MTFAVRGIIEGFYDRLWSWPVRERFARQGAELGFNVYAYAPKEDRLQNAGWRTPYPDQQRRKLAAFTELCRANGVEPWLGLRPVGISYVDQSDLELVTAKLRDYVQLGAARVVLLADDIPAELDARTGGRFASLAEAHAWLIDEVLAEIDGVELVFCPTDYCGPVTDYQRTLGARVPTQVELFWTGPDVCSREIGNEAATEVSGAFRRRPLVWDNYPVNDDGMVDQLHIGPIRGRDPGLWRAVSGVLVNPALQPKASLIPLATWADYLREPEGYDPEASWQRALLRVCGNQRDADAVAALAAAVDRSAIAQPWRLPYGASVNPLASHAASIANQRLRRELAPFLAQLPRSKPEH